MGKPLRLACIFLLHLLCGGVAEGWAQEEGIASYYHKRFHGRKAASGEVLSEDALVAAHRTHPFGTYLRVTNLANLKNVIVHVTDRGPFRKSRILDVSPAAAEKLDFIKKGITKVRVEVVPGPIDLRYLSLIYPQIPHLDIDRLRITPPHKMRFVK